MLEVMKGREMDRTENRRRRRKGDRKMKDLMNTLKAGVTLRCKYREKMLHKQRSSTTGLAQGGIKEIVAGKSILGRVVEGGRDQRAGRSFQKNGE